MALLERFSEWLGLRAADGYTVDVLPPARSSVAPISDRGAMAVPSVFRALAILTTSAEQLTIDARRGNGPVSRQPAILRRPSVDLRLDEWLSQVVLDLAIDGNAYARKVTGPDGDILDLPLLPAGEVTVSKDHRTNAVRYHHGQKSWPASDIVHLALIRRAGWLKGIAPIEAARRGLTFTSAASDYAAGWFHDTGHPGGILSSDQALTRAQATEYRDVWNGLDADGNRIDVNNPSGVKVLGRGLKYEPLLLKPADVLWLEAQDFTTVDVARIFGIPSTLMLVGIDGGAQTYANVSQEWLAFTRFTLMKYLRPIEAALGDLLPRGMDARFNLDALLRSDTSSRYEAHALALAAGFLTVNEVRAIEGLPALADPAADLAAPAAVPALDQEDTPA